MIEIYESDLVTPRPEDVPRWLRMRLEQAGLKELDQIHGAIVDGSLEACAGIGESTARAIVALFTRSTLEPVSGPRQRGARSWKVALSGPQLEHVVAWSEAGSFTRPEAVRRAVALLRSIGGGEVEGPEPVRDVAFELRVLYTRAGLRCVFWLGYIHQLTPQEVMRHAIDWAAKRYGRELPEEAGTLAAEFWPDAKGA